jgi:hypothetical protein
MSEHSDTLSARPGDWVEVRSKEEILATLGPDATHDSLPFMPEMLQYCGQRLQVYKRADKTCDTVNQTGGRRMRNTVHLEGARCDGSGHGGCEAGCLIFWRESWLKRVDQAPVPTTSGTEQPGCTETDIRQAAVVDPSEEVYRCQATELPQFTELLKWWDVRQYVRDYVTNGLRLGTMIRAFLFAGYRALVEAGIGYGVLVRLYDRTVPRFGGTRFPMREGTCDKTPTAVLDLQPGEMVQVRTYEDILSTLNRDGLNRGLRFDCEMVKFCGHAYPVKKRVQRILNEKTGKMMHFSNPCIVLDNVACCAETTKYRLFCPRSILIYWREIWLERAADKKASLS